MPKCDFNKVAKHGCDALRDLVSFAQFKERTKTPMEECNNTLPWAFFYVSKIVQMVTNHAKHHKFVMHI